MVSPCPRWHVATTTSSRSSRRCHMLMGRSQLLQPGLNECETAGTFSEARNCEFAWPNGSVLMWGGNRWHGNVRVPTDCTIVQYQPSFKVFQSGFSLLNTCIHSTSTRILTTFPSMHDVGLRFNLRVCYKYQERTYCSPAFAFYFFLCFY